MTKELFVSSTPHETKIGLVEDDQLAEIYFERENEYTLAGSIYKGRVTRVLPGMQSAFVDVGLERDAFLYVSDFFEIPEEQEEFEELVLSRQPAEMRAPQRPQPQEEAEAPPASGPGGGEAQSQAGQAAAPPAPPNAAQQPSPEAAAEGDDQRGWRSRRRRRGRRGRGLPESKYARLPQPGTVRSTDYAPPREYAPVILPGESISKYQHLRQAPPEPGTAPSGETHQPPANQESTPSAGAPEAPTQEVRRESTYAAPLEWGESAAPVQVSPQPSAESRQERLSRQEREERLEQMNVAAVFGGAAAEPSPASEAWRDRGAEEEQAGGREESAHSSLGAAPGTIEEEEIEDEEADLPGYGEAEEEEEAEEFEELEEETHEADKYHSGQEEEIAAGQEITEAAEESAEEAEAMAQEYAEEEESEGERDSELEAAQNQGAGLAEGEGEAREAPDRAELRGPADTAAYQQRAERAGFDRQRSGRPPRGGRRFRSRRNFQRPHVMIADLLKEGQEVLVQIAKEPIGKKGARITSHIALPGRFLVYMPTVNHTGVSRKIATDEERQRLKRIVLSERDNGHGGFIVRTAAEHASEDELRADIRFLKNLWAEIKNRAENSKSPALIYHDLNLVERILRDQVTQDFSQIWVDNEPEYERVVRFISRFQPGLVKRVKLYTKTTPLFEQFNLQEEINKALKSKVWLKSGGYIVINQTEALVAIDVNTGKYVGKTARLEDTIVKTNVDAIKEIVRQIRLRDLGGIIVIDFIDMDERRNRQKVMQALEEALRSDRAPSKVLQFNDFGLVAITRKRVKQSLERTLGAPCPYCTGTGLVKSVGTVCNEIYTEMRKIAKQLERGDVMLRVNPEVGQALKANNGRWLQDLEEVTGRSVIVKTDATLHQEQFDIN